MYWGKLYKKSFLLFFFILLIASSVYAQENDDLLKPTQEIEINNTFKTNQNNNYFNLANIVDNFLNSEIKSTENPLDKKSTIRKDFISASSKFNQGNASVAREEYEKLINKLDNDISLLTLSKVLYEIGLFSLAQEATEKIVYKNQFYENILDLEKSYKPKANLTKEQEIYFAKIYSSIFFDNSSQEAIFELLSKKNEFQKNDYYNFMLAKAYLESKKYSEALNFINKTISINPTNVSYKILKIDILINAKKYKDAQKLISKIEEQYLTVNFVDYLKIQKETVLSCISDNKDKKYHSVKKAFLEGNYEKVKNDCQNILNFDKDNNKIITLYAKSELALGNIERANSFFVNAQKIQKNNNETLIGIGDIKYLHGDYKNAVKTYKKALNNDKNNYEIILKLLNAQRQNSTSSKELKKLEAKLDKMPKTSYLDYYSSALSIAQKNDVLKEAFLKKALEINPVHENSIGALIELYLKNKNFQLAKGLIYNASFTLEKNYYYYYLCGLYNQAVNKKNDAIQFYKTSLNLNPNFEIANVKLLKLIPEITNEEI